VLSFLGLAQRVLHLLKVMEFGLVLTLVHGRFTLLLMFFSG